MQQKGGIKGAASIVAFGLSFLFFVQSAAILVQSVYILDLMNLELDAKAAALLFFFSPLLLPLFRGRAARLGTWLSLSGLLLARLSLPWLDTEGRLLASGFAVAAALVFIPLSWKRLSAARPESLGLPASQGFALSIALSIFLRALGQGLDASLEAGGEALGILLGLALLAAFAFVTRGSREAAAKEEETSPRSGAAIGAANAGAFGAAFGAGQLSLLVLSWFAFSSPGVIARWTGLGELPISLATSLLSLLWIFAADRAPALVLRPSRGFLALWNLAFAAALAALIAINTPSFPDSPGLVRVVGSPGALHRILLALLLILFPVLFVDFALLSGRRAAEGRESNASAFRSLGAGPGLALGSAWLCLLVFANIFSNVWAYVPPASTPFRGQYWLSFALAAALPGVLAALRKRPFAIPASEAVRARAGGRANLIGAGAGSLALLLLFGATLAAELPRRGPSAPPAGREGLRVMSYNIQQGVDGDAQRVWAEQLELIRRIDPDLLALQESDSARISLGNDDFTRRFAAELGYYSYYGPSTAAGTFGTAILSRYPLEETEVFYSFSDEDEVGTSRARLGALGKTWTIYCVHPAGSEAVDLSFAAALLERSAGEPLALALGDYNLRRGEAGYEKIAASMTEAWSAFRPGSSDPDPARGWIDHIFVSPGIRVLDAAYILPPDSHSDHPAHWADLQP